MCESTIDPSDVSVVTTAAEACNPPRSPSSSAFIAVFELGARCEVIYDSRMTDKVSELRQTRNRPRILCLAAEDKE